MNAVADRFCSSPSGKDHHCISECKQRKCCQVPQSPDLNIKENIWDELKCRVWRTGATVLYSDHSESTESKTSQRVEQPPAELALCDANETPMSCCSVQCGGHISCKVYMAMDAAAGLDLRIL